MFMNWVWVLAYHIYSIMPCYSSKLFLMICDVGNPVSHKWPFSVSWQHRSGAAQRDRSCERCCKKAKGRESPPNTFLVYWSCFKSSVNWWAFKAWIGLWQVMLCPVKKGLLTKYHQIEETHLIINMYTQLLFWMWHTPHIFLRWNFSYSMTKKNHNGNISYVLTFSSLPFLYFAWAMWTYALIQ